MYIHVDNNKIITLDVLLVNGIMINNDLIIFYSSSSSSSSLFRREAGIAHSHAYRNN